MTVSIEDKIELFRKMIFSEIENSSSDRKQRILERFEAEKKKLQIESEEKRQQIINEAIAKAEKEMKQLISKAQSEQYHRLLNHKQRFVDDMMELLKKRADDFTKSESYKAYLSEHLSHAAELLKEKPMVYFYFTKRDMEYAGDYIRGTIEKLRGNMAYSLREAKPYIIGGFIVEDEKQVMQMDYTLKSLVEENRELIGSVISHRLDEVKH